MKVAFDVKGTLEGHYEHKVRTLYDAFEKLGCEMVIWSSLGSFAYDFARKNSLKAAVMTKFANSEDLEPSEKMDLAIDDDYQQEYLATHKLILVSEIPELPVDIELFAKSLVDQMENRQK